MKPIRCMEDFQDNFMALLQNCANRININLNGYHSCAFRSKDPNLVTCDEI
jgi:hypothetical protein